MSFHCTCCRLKKELCKLCFLDFGHKRTDTLEVLNIKVKNISMMKMCLFYKTDCINDVTVKAGRLI